jgi:glucokinase
MFTIGIDVGGTQIRAAGVDSNGRLFSPRRAPTPRSGDELFDWIALEIQRIRSESECGPASAVGLALPGIVDRERGLLVRSVNLPSLECRPIREELANRIGLPISLMSDADAATWGEYSACTPRPGAFVHLRLGTGVACGIVVDDRLQSTGAGRTTHWDILVVDDGPEAALCPCGLRGCLETIASGPALESHAAQMGFGNGLDGLQQAWERHDPAARTIISSVANATASAIYNLKSQIPNGAVVCLGGGVITALPCLVEQTAIRLRSRDNDLTRRVTVHPPRLGDDAGVIGAAMLARDAHTKSRR